MHPAMILVFALLSAVALIPALYVAFVPDVVPVNLGGMVSGPAPAGAIAKTNQDPQQFALIQPQTAETGAMPRHDPDRIGPMPAFAPPLTAVPAQPEPAAPTASSAAVFFDADTMLYARQNARLRAAPGTAADILTTLAANAPLRATARTTDGEWWRVSLAGPGDQPGRIGYVHRTAVAKEPLVKVTPAAPAPVAAAAAPQRVPARRNQDLLGYVTDTMDWLAGRAGSGPAPKVIRTER